MNKGTDVVTGGVEEVKEVKTIFDASFDETPDELVKQEKELKKREMKRDFEKNYDKTEENIIGLERSQRDMVANKMAKFDINAYRKNMFQIAQNVKAQEEMKDLYMKFFGEVLKR